MTQVRVVVFICDLFGVLINSLLPYLLILLEKQERKKGGGGGGGGLITPIIHAFCFVVLNWRCYLKFMRLGFVLKPLTVIHV